MNYKNGFLSYLLAMPGTDKPVPNLRQHLPIL